ncbi:hypothetical protein DdX_20297 [Ditylenchus destructor]|uniref:Uncharacterized protein n=1 Tax=Ditylenchus destructor TaxID=166010 RepID=A0AAD4QRW9_9BILA|nr:hypothetical protein DdX_20297 [Ditylenchus destructor]
MFNKELSSEEYNKWIVRNGYSKQVPHEGQIVGKECSENFRDIYQFFADIYQNPNNCHGIATTVFYAHVELKDENWPVFQHFIRLLMDPFIYIRTLELNPQKDVLSLLTGAMNPDRDRLQCKSLIIQFYDDVQKLVVWMKDHVHCDEFEIYVRSDLNYDEELLDLFLTGAPCTSAINVMNYDFSKVIVNLLQKFMALKNRDEYQVVESIQGNVEGRKIVDEFKRNFAEFIGEEEQYEGFHGSRKVIRFINNDIEKKLTLDVRNDSYGSFSIKITNT